MRRTRFELRKARERGHILEGLAVALANVDEMIALIKASATPPEAKTALMARAWQSPVVDEMLKRAVAAQARPEGLPPGFGATSERLQALRRAGAGDPRAAAAAADRPRAGQDHRRVPPGDGPDRRPHRHPREARARDDDRRRRAEGDPRRVRRQAPLRDRRAGRRPVDRGPDRAAGHGRHDLARRLHEGAGGRRVPRAAARRARQAGDRDEGGRLRRAHVHREHARLHPVLLQPRPRLLAQGLRTCRRAAARRAASRSSTSCRSPTTRRSPRSCRSRSSPRRSTCSWRPRWARSRRRALVRLLAAARRPGSSRSTSPTATG